jgi:competence factor transporting protein
MDEATSALDNQLQNQIIDNIKALNCTIIFIAHRLRIAEGADQILVLENGEIVERGMHKDLLSKGSTYAKMWSSLR